MIFNIFDFDAMRDFVWSQPTSRFSSKVARIELFDYYRNIQDYEAIYAMVIEFGGIIE